jgi:BCD family chlorophyll transporter-like MFS transporter
MGWLGICRLGLVQAALGAVVVVITSTLNRVMVVEYALPAILPGLLVALQYGVQFVRPRFGFESDVGARRTPWIVGGMAVLAGGGVLCAWAVGEVVRHPWGGLILAAAAYAVVGLGVGAAGTSLLVLVANRVGERRAAAATIMWILMIAGFAVTSTAVGHFLDPFSPQRLLLATLVVAVVAFCVTVAALWNIETPETPAQSAHTRSVCREHADRAPAERARPTRDFRASLARVWAEPKARDFTLFVFISMLAYSAQELLLEPFAGLVFGYSLGASAQLSGLWHAAALVGMIGVGVACSGARRAGGARRLGSLRGWTLGGCIGSGVARRGGLGRASLAFTSLGDGAGRGEWGLRSRRHRLHDGTFACRRRCQCGRAYGTVGGRASRGIRPGRPDGRRHRGFDSSPLGVTHSIVCHRVHGRGGSLFPRIAFRRQDPVA